MILQLAIVIGLKAALEFKTTLFCFEWNSQQARPCLWFLSLFCCFENAAELHLRRPYYATLQWEAAMMMSGIRGCGQGE